MKRTVFVLMLALASTAHAATQLEIGLSARLCAQRAYLATQRHRLQEEHAIGATGGAVDLAELHSAARAIHEVQRAIRATLEAVHLTKARRPIACSNRDVQEVEACTRDLVVGLEAKTAWHSGAPACRAEVKATLHFVAWFMDEIEDAELNAAAQGAP